MRQSDNAERASGSGCIAVAGAQVASTPSVPREVFLSHTSRCRTMRKGRYPLLLRGLPATKTLPGVLRKAPLCPFRMALLEFLLLGNLPSQRDQKGKKKSPEAPVPCHTVLSRDSLRGGGTKKVLWGFEIKWPQVSSIHYIFFRALYSSWAPLS